MWKQFVKDYFNFTAKERRGVIIIVVLIIIFIFIPFLFPLFLKQEAFSHSEFEHEIARLAIEKKDTSKAYSKNFNTKTYNDYFSNGDKKSETGKAPLFYFDPKVATAEDWKKLGLKDKTIHTIQNYISKGGKFYKPEDISKIWGLSPSDAQRLIPYVSIKNTATPVAPFEKREYQKRYPAAYAAKSIQPVDMNLADTSAYISLPGIGSKLSQRIIAFREKLGGFYSVDQVGETYLLPDSTFQKIKPRLVIGNAKVKQININTASIEEMKAHPYLRYNLANAIFQYRQQHGNFNSVEEIKKIMLVTEDAFHKVAPYLSVQ